MARTKYYSNRDKDQIPISTIDRKPGRPERMNGFKEEYIKMAYEAMKDGCSSVEAFGKLIGHSGNVVDSWRRKSKAFDTSLIEGRDEYNNREVELALVDRALGFDYDEVREESIVLFEDNDDGTTYIEQKEPGKTLEDGTKITARTILVKGVKRTITRKKVLPDMLAIFFLLQNRSQKRWKNVQKQIVEQYTKVDVTQRHQFDLSNVPADQLRQLRDIVISASPIEKRGLA